ncbi:MAG: sensor histidine kinase [Flavobacteriales bacterium]|nr:sensor histidine kinase [Flavobacteriales bacterium]
MLNFRIAFSILSLILGVWVSVCAAEEESLQKILDQAALLQQADPDSAISLLMHADVPSIGEESDEFFEVLFKLGVIFEQTSAYDKAMFYLDSAEHVGRRLASHLLISKALNSKGVVYLNRGVYDNALEHFIQALEEAEYTDKQEVKISAITNAGHVAFYQGNLSDAMNYYKRGNEMALASGDTLAIVRTMSHIALVHQVQENYKEALQINEEGLRMFLESKQAPDLVIATLYQDLAVCSKNMGDFEQASEYFERAIEVCTKLDNKEGVAQAYVNRAIMWIESGSPSKAIDPLNKALVICNSVGSKQGQMYSHKSLSDAFVALNMPDSALVHYVRYHEIGEEILSKSTQEQLNEMRTKFETAEKEKQIAELEIEKERQFLEIEQRDNAIERLWIIFGAGFLVFSLIIVLFFIYRHNQELKRKRRRQKHFAEEMIRWQENERKRVAGELHDGIGQSLVMVKNHLQKIRGNYDEESDHSPLQKVEDAVADTIQEVRQISYSLRPFHLEILGLEGSINELLKDIEITTQLNVESRLDGLDGAFGKETEIHVFRMIQEGLQNIVKHARATKVSCEVKDLGDRLRIYISDDGHGFDVSIVFAKVSGLGLLGMKERVDFLGGEFQIDSAHGKGSSLVFILPKSTQHD